MLPRDAHRAALAPLRGGAVLAFARLVDLVGALARPLAAGARVGSGAALTLAAALRRWNLRPSCPPWPALRRPWNATPAVCDGTGQ